MRDENASYLFNEVPLYTKQIFSVLTEDNGFYSVNENELDRLNKYIGTKQDRLVTYCRGCKKEFPFKIKTDVWKIHLTGIGSTDTLQLSTTYGYMEFDTRSGEITTKTDQINKNIIWDDKIWYKNFLFECTHNSDHIYLMTIALEFRKGAFTIRKIGQYPSMLTVKGFDFDKYKQFLEEINAYEDYKKADLSFAEHFYVGAYAYLRRIFEKLINKYLCGTELSHENMETKIKATKERFDSRIRDSLTNLYGILSIGIHQLEEDESERYYIYLKAIIDIQLEYEKTEKDKDSQAKKYSSILGQIRSELGKR